ncbi:hypothetical protein DRJ25_06445, partial [Candidatus Woesearchaeota archaeon]
MNDPHEDEIKKEAEEKKAYDAMKLKSGEDETKGEVKKPETKPPEKLSMKSLQEQIDNMNKTEEEIEAEVERRVTAAIEAMGDKEFKVKNGRIAGTKILVMTPDEYRVHSAKSGLIMGR